jgi:hypothetical protein
VNVKQRLLQLLRKQQLQRKQQPPLQHQQPKSLQLKPQQSHR